MFGDAQLMVRAAVLAQTVILIRIAARQGLALPRDSGQSPEFEAVALEFAGEVEQVFAGERD